MKRFKKGVIFLLVLCLSLSAAGAMAAEEATPYGPPVGGEWDEELPLFTPLRGTVREVRDGEFVEGSRYVFVQTDEGKTAYLVVTGETYFVNDREVGEGSVVTGWYDANLPIIMIYPPQYTAVVMVVEPLEEFIKVDRFDDELVSLDNELKLNIGEETEIILQDGTPFAGELANRDLVVTYDVSTRSIPAQTTPHQIVVLFEKAVPPAVPPITSVPKEDVHLFMPVGAMDIVVENRVIDGPAAYVNEESTVMLPLRAIAEALGFRVAWNGEMQLVMLGDSFTVTIGEDAYVDLSRDELISIGVVPELVDGRTFVPLSFFREVIPMNNAYVFEEQIVINNDAEVMR